MTEKYIIDNMIADYKNNLDLYSRMERYYNGDHDINYSYFETAGTNNVVIHNYCNVFVNEEVQYSLGNPLAYVPMGQDSKIADDVYKNLFHWKENHNQEVMRTLQIFGKCYLLHYIDAQGRFCERIIDPLRGIAYTDIDDIPQYFIHFYKLKYDLNEYYDIYYPDGRIITFRGNTPIKKSVQPFGGVPVTICKFDRIEDTIYYKIKPLQDAYNQIMSDQCNTISDYRNAYLFISGAMLDEEQKKELKKRGIINIPTANSGATAKWIVKDMPDGYIQNMINNLKSAMYAVCNHIDGNEKLQSNTSGSALRNRLVFLEQRCNMVLSIVVDAAYERLARLFYYLDIRGTKHDIQDIKVVASPSIPQDEISIVQMLSQLGIGDHISLETSLSLLPFIENPANEIAKINNEREQNKSIELDKLDYEDDIDG